MREEAVVVTSDTGLHARPAAAVVETANRFKADVRIIKAGKEANAKSVVNLLTLGASKGTEVVIRADGPDEEAALNGLLALTHIFSRKAPTGPNYRCLNS